MTIGLKRPRSHSDAAEHSISSPKRGTSVPLYTMNHEPSTTANLTEPAAVAAYLTRTKMESGQTWFLVDRAWWSSWTSNSDNPGAIDNSKLLDEYGNLRPGLVEGVEVEYVPQQVWDALVARYGEANHPLPRLVILRGDPRFAAPSLELHPPTVFIRRLVRASETPGESSASALLAPTPLNPNAPTPPTPATTPTPSPSPADLAAASPPGPIKMPTVTLSSQATIAELAARAARSVSPTADSSNLPPYRVWRLDPDAPSPDAVDTNDSPELTLSALPAFNPRLLDANHNFQSDAEPPEALKRTLTDTMIESGDVFVVEFAERDTADSTQPWRWLVPDAPGGDNGAPPTYETTATDSVALSSTEAASSEFTPAPLFASSDGFFNRMSRSDSGTVTVGASGTSSGVSTAIAPKSGSLVVKDYNSPAPSTQARKIDPGTLGLGNLGNTCFMNSALQCLAHQQELADYFLSGVYTSELNRDNPLGMGGAIAEVFGALLHRIWNVPPPPPRVGALNDLSSSSNSSKSFFTPGSMFGSSSSSFNSSATSYAPREFKSVLQRFAPQFSGYQQHDSQELVAFLLDGLHEDLNRVLKKPYVEKPEWEWDETKAGPDPETERDRALADLAKRSWDGYMLRNDSVIVDLFQGQYQSTLVCPECEKVSITFDPFMYLTLPLPVEKKWRHTVFYVPWDLSKPHVKVPVELGRDSSFRDLRNLLGRWMNAEPDNLLTLEIFNNRFYKNLDDALLCGEMADNDQIVCFELPCHARQSRTYDKKKPDPDAPFIIPLYLCDAVNPRGYPSFMAGRGSSPALFGYPAVIAISQEQARSPEKVYEAVVERLERWTANARDLYVYGWEGSEINAVPIQLGGPDIITEISESGDVVTRVEPVDGAAPSEVEEGDITDEKAMVLVPDDEISLGGSAPVRLRPKADLFNLRVQANHKDYGAGYAMYGHPRYDSWESRVDDAEKAGDGLVLHDADALYCEFDENMKAFFFGDDRSRWENARWDTWDTFVHPELEAATSATTERQTRGLSLQDCLAEFTKEERLGADDLWYCPRCKKHQQATKKFDLWSAPDVLVVHLKRFSNSRTLRDKIDAFIDFPVEGLDLSDIVGERRVAKQLHAQGVDVEALGMQNVDEPLVYDLFGVDEHMGGLGGGHYRAYALNHVTDKWYHFDDSYVTPAKAEDSVNANAYLLFYRRRSSAPLGGKTYEKIKETRLAMQNAEAETSIESISQTPNDGEGPPADPSADDSLAEDQDMAIDPQLPTPPYESEDEPAPFNIDTSQVTRSRWFSSGTAGVPTPPEDDDILNFSVMDDMDDSFSEDALQRSLRRFDFPDPSDRASTTSSNEAEPDLEGPDTDAIVESDSLSQSQWTNISGVGTPPDSSGVSEAGGNPQQEIVEMPGQWGDQVAQPKSQDVAAQND